MTIVANPHYWGPKPFYTRIVMKQTETAASQAQLLQSGEANIAMQLNPVTAASLQGQSGITIKTIPSFNVLWIGMSSEPKNKYVQGPHDAEGPQGDPRRDQLQGALSPSS